MSTLLRIIGVLLCLHLGFYSTSLAADDLQRVEAENIQLQLDIQVYKAEIRRLNAIIEGQMQGGGEVSDSYKAYLEKFYDQESRSRERNLRALEWQIFAANCILILVFFLVCAGIIFAGYQLWISSRLGRELSSSMDLELSAQKVRVQSSVVGVIVLIISGAFLILFLDRVYSINLVASVERQQRTNVTP